MDRTCVARQIVFATERSRAGIALIQAGIDMLGLDVSPESTFPSITRLIIAILPSTSEMGGP